MAKYRIDINCDLGEIPYDASPQYFQLLDYISSCNIATGFHAGDPNTIFKTIQEAGLRGVAIGVHPSYMDRKGFGRVSVKMSEDKLYASLVYQTAALSGMCTMAGTRLHHIKLHGALYHDAHHKEQIARVVIRFLENWPEPLLIYGQTGSLLEKIALERGMKWVQEGFIDRRYQSDGTLLPRGHERAIISNPESAIDQALEIITNQKVQTFDQKMIHVSAKTLCIHGDHSGARHLALQLIKKLQEQHIALTPPEL